jgi:hypothetical protein
MYIRRGSVLRVAPNLKGLVFELVDGQRYLMNKGFDY